MKTKKRDKRKSFLAVLLSACMLLELLPMTAIAAFASSDDPYSYKFSQDAVVEAVEEAVDQERVVTEKLDFQGESAGTYDALFAPDGTLYELSLDTMGLKDSAQRDAVLSLRVFARVSGNGSEEDGYQADGSEKLLFLLANNSPEVVTVKIYMDNLESHRITVLPAEEIVSDASVVTEPEAAAEAPEEQAVEVQASEDTAVAEEPAEAEVTEEAAEPAEAEETDVIDEVDEAEEVIPEEEPEAVIDLQEDEEAAAEAAEPEEEQIEIVSEQVSEQAEASPAAETEEVIVEETTEAETTQTELPEEAAIASDKLLNGTIYDAVCLGTDGAAAFATTLTVENGISTLAAGDLYTVTYEEMDDYDVLEFPSSNPTEVSDGAQLEFSIIIPDGYGFESVTANGVPLSAFDSQDLDEEGTMYENFYKYPETGGVDGDVVIQATAYKGQIIDGYGQITVRDRSAADAEYTVTIKDVPTNTPISIGYMDIEITDSTGEVLSGVNMTGRLYYVPEGSLYETDEWQAVSYFQLDGSSLVKTEDGRSYYTVVPYGTNEDGSVFAFDMEKGSLYLKNTASISARAEVMPIQTNTLCALDEDGNYTQELIDATEMSSNAQVYYYPGFEGEVVSLSALTNGLVEMFFYGNLKKGIGGITECTEAEIVYIDDTNPMEYELLPLDSNGNPVSDFGNLYMEYDKVYSFDVEVESIVNEHTEDNGDVYLWMGDTYYVDKYHNQGTTTSNYTNTVPATNYSSAGVWVQLGALREPLINSGTDFSTYASVTKDQLEAEGVTTEIANAVSANYNYGIAGPYKVADGATDVKKSTARVTGHIGDEFVASDVFGTEVVYMATDASEFHETDWVDLGAHASDTGTRAWWYWINDFYRLNNYEDELEFLEIAEREDSTTGETQVRLEADEMGASGLGEEYDVWNIDLITKRESVVETDMMTNPDKYTADGVGFSNIAGLPHHVQLRMNGTFETVGEDGETYFGELTVLSDEDDEGNLGPKAPYIEYSIPAVYSDGSSAGTVTGSSYIIMENEQEATSLAFTDANGTNVYVPLEYIFNDSQVVISVVINFEGTITSSSGETITYTYDNPYTYTGTLTAAQLKEAYDTCPNNAGYDFAVNLSEAVQKEINTNTATIIYKVWDDDSNANNSRGNVSDVVVTLERSEDGTVWEPVTAKDGSTEFTISAPMDENGEQDLNANQWSLVLTEDVIDLTYTNSDGETAYYEFRIATEEPGEGQETNEEFTYNTIITGTTVTNTLLRDTLDISGEKLWINSDGTPLSVIPVDSVIITLYQDGNYFGRQTIGKQTIGNDSDWTFSFENLPVWNGSVKYEYTLGEMMSDGTQVQEGDTFLIGNERFHIEIIDNGDGSYTFANVTDPEKDVDADGDGEYGDTGVGVLVGDTVTYEIGYRNTSDYEATVTITDKLDEGLTYVNSDGGGVYDLETHTITWIIGVSAHTYGNVHFTATVNENALVKNEVENTATVQVGDDPATAVDTNTVYNPVPDKDVDADGDGEFKDSGMQVQVGDTLVYKIDYENPDDDPATVTITDAVDVGLDYVSSTDDGSYDESERLITWVIEDVAAHTNGSVYFTATVNENALEKNVVENTATVQVGDHPAQDTKTVYNPIPAKDVDADGDGTYGDTGVGVQVGDTLTYEIGFANGYDEMAYVTITDVLDEGLDFVTASDSGYYDEATRTITWRIGVSPHTSDSVTFTAVVNENALVKNEVENTATVQVGDDSSNTIITNTVYNPIPDKDVDANGDGIFEDSGVQVDVGDTLVYKIDYENPDEDPATVTITDEVDVGLDFVSATDNGSYDETSRMITWVIEDVEPHTNGSVYFTATVNEEALVKHEVDNTATVQVGEHDAQKTKTVYNPIPEKDVDVNGDGTYGDSGVGVYVGDTLTYEITYTNGYDIPATVIITDELDVGLTFVSASDDGTYDASTRTITWTFEGVEAHTTGSVTFTATVNEDALIEDVVENTARIRIDNNEADTNTVYNPLPDKNVDADGDEVYDDSGMQVNVGDTLVYKIDYENPDATPATVTITDELDEGLDFVDATDNGTYDETTRTITWTIEGVEAHTFGSVYLTATVNENALVKNEVDNMATVKVGERDAQQTKTVYNPIPEKGVDVNGDEKYDDSGVGVKVGDTLEYEITYTNGYTTPATVIITDELDVGLTFVSASDEGTYDETTRTITWTFEGVEALYTGSVTFTAKVNENALVEDIVENTAIVQVDNNSAYTNTVYNPIPDKNVDADGDGEYKDSGMQVNVGDTLVYKIDYENPDATLATVTITDVLDEGLDFVSATDNGSYDETSRTVTWEIENVAPQTDGSVYLTVTVNETALVKNEVDNTATVQVGEHDAQRTKTVYNPIPEKGVDVNGDELYDDSGVSVKVGDSVAYEITYRNDYNDPATVTITDKLDEGLDFVSATNGGTYDASTRTVTWVIADVDAHTTGSVTFTATVNENALVKNEVENTATVQIGDDPDTAIDTNTVYNPVPDKDVDADGDGEYKDSGMQVQVGDTLVYKIDYENPDDTAAIVTITDEVDVGLDYVSCTDGGVYNEATRTITWVIENVEPHTNGSVTFTATVNMSALDKHEVDNTATVQVGEHDAQQTKTVYNPIPDKDVDANGDGTYGDTGVSVQVGDTLTYEITYANRYNTAATVTITDELDEGLDFVEAADGGTYDASTRTVTWVIEDVEAQTFGSVTFTATVNETALVRNEIDNTATVQVGDHPAVDTNTVYNPVPDKNVDANGDGEFDDSGMQVLVGDTLVYKIDYENPDDTVATVTITDVLDAGLDYISSTDGGVYNDATRTITWVIEDVEEHTNGSVYFTAIVNEDALEKNEVENTATVQVGDHPAQDTKTVYNPIPGKDVDVDNDETYGDSGVGVKVGDTLTYEISYDNGYDDPAIVTITDVLNQGLDFVEASDGGTYNEETRTITWTITNVAAHESGSVTFTATVNENALVRNEVENTATVQVGDDPDMAIDTNTVYNPIPDKDVDANGDEVFEDSGMQVHVGDTLVYKIDYENPDDTAATVTIADVLDAGLDYVSSTDEGTYNESTRTITWVIEGVDPHTNGSVYFTATVNENALEKNVVENTATVQVGDHPAQDTKTVYNPIPGKDVDVDNDGTYGDSGVGVQVGDTLTYEIGFANGYDEMAYVTITDVLDEGLDFVTASDGGTYDEATRTITWRIGLSPHTSDSVTFTAVVNENALVQNEVDNKATVQVGDNPDNTIETNPVENPVPDKNVDANGDGEFDDSGLQVQVGGTVVYKIDYENPDDTAATVTITDEVDVGLDFVEATDNGSYDSASRMITWVIEGVEPHTNGSVYFTATVNENALEKNEVENTATVQVGNHEAQQTKTVYNPIPEKDVYVNGDTQDDSGESVHIGDSMTYEITYRNSYDTAADVTITDVLDEGLNFVSASDDGVYDEATRTITWTIKDVDAHTTGSVTFTATVNDSALDKNEIDNTAIVQVGDDPNNTTWTNPVENPVPDKNVDANGDGEFDDSGMQVQVGGTLVYKIDYENPDATSATVTITDELDEGLDFVEATDNGSYDESSRMITWVLEDVEAHTSGSVYFTATVNENALVKNEVENTATVQVGEHEAQQTKTVYNPIPGKDVDANADGTYGDNGESVQVGDTMAYEITYRNSYDTAATVTITDVLDEGLTFVSATDGGVYDDATRTITWTIEDVDAFTSGSVSFTATVNENALVVNVVENTAIVQVGDNPDNTVETNPVENPVPDKNVDANGDGDFDDSGMQVQVGGELIYKIDYENPDATAATVTITDELDEGLDFVSATDNGSYDSATRTITWVIDGVEAHTSGSVTFTATVNENALVKNEVENTATVQVGEHEAQQTKTVYNPIPEKAVDANADDVFEDDGMKVNVGDDVTYEITYKNSYDEAATVTITDVLDEGLDFVSATDNGSYDSATRTITWVIDNVDAHTAGSVSFTATVNENAMTKAVVENTASVQIGDDPAVDTNKVENPLEPDEPTEPEKSIDVGDGTEVSVGEDVVYTITYYNNYNEAVVVTVTDVLDEGLDFVSATDGGTYNESTRTVTWTLENVPAFTHGDVSFTATVNENAKTNMEVDNGASVQIGDDPAMDTNIVQNPLTPDEGTPNGGNPNGGNPDDGNPDSGTPNSGTPSSGTPTSSNPNSGTTSKTLPQTGQLNWPIWLMAGLGIIVVALGIVMMQVGKKNKRKA